MMIFRNWLVDVLGFSKSEAKGTFVLIIIVLLTAIVPRIMYFYYDQHTSLNISNQKELVDWSAEITGKITLKSQKTSAEKAATVYNKKVIPLNPTLFDPNEVNAKALMKMGLEDRVSERIEKYVEKGGRFFKKEDLQKIYGLSQSEYNQLAPFIEIKENKSFKKETIIESIPMIIDLNSADTINLKAIRGIGDKLSQRIVNYREKLGGFYHISQLHEVYGLDSSVIKKMESRFSTEKTHRTISINTDSIRHLANHPYISYKLARAIVNYRKTHGDYEELKNLKAIIILDSLTYEKIVPYLRLKP